MRDIEGSRTLPFPKGEVWCEGLSAEHWRYDEGGLLIDPQKERIRKGGKVDIEINHSLIKKVAFTAVVSECVKNEHVIVVGKVDQKGDVRFFIGLKDGKEANSTDAKFVLGADLKEMGRLARLAIETPLRSHLSSEMEPFADRLAGSISSVLAGTEDQAKSLRLAS